MARNEAVRAASREADRQRKRARREVARLRRAAGEAAPGIGRELRRQARALEQAIELSTVRGARAQVERKGYKRKTAEQVRAQAMETLRGVETRPKAAERRRRDAIFQAEIATFSRQGSEGPSIFGVSNAKVKVFYRATQRLWEGGPVKERNNAIIKGLGVQTLQQAFDKVMRAQSEKVLQAVYDAERDPEGIQRGGESADSYTSPDYVLTARQIR